MIALTLLVLGASSTVSALLGVSSLNRDSEERSRAHESIQNMIEAMQAEEFSEVFARFNATAADDPVGGSSPGTSFAATALAARAGDADGLPGEIVFPGGGLVLREDGVDREAGMPRDLNGDGLIDLADHAGDYTILPMRVRVRWRGARGEQELEFAVTLSNDKNAP